MCDRVGVDDVGGARACNGSGGAGGRRNTEANKTPGERLPMPHNHRNTELTRGNLALLLLHRKIAYCAKSYFVPRNSTTGNTKKIRKKLLKIPKSKNRKTKMTKKKAKKNEN